jgi:hypothetical protein
LVRRLTRRGFLRFSGTGIACALWGGKVPARGRTVAVVENNILEAIEASDEPGAEKLLAEAVSQGMDPWQIHLSLFPVAQRVLNPPFINPHLPKMYAINRELVFYLGKDRIASLVALEIREYARRTKMEKIPRAYPSGSTVSFTEIESAIREKDTAKAAALMAAFCDQKGRTEFTRRLLLLGSGYLKVSLGHSLSCTAFILMEMLHHPDQDPWPALCALANYFCQGHFQTTPGIESSPPFSPEANLESHLSRASSGRGFANLHETITGYAVARVREFFTPAEENHLWRAWMEFLGNKKEERVILEDGEPGDAEDYDRFSAGKANSLVASFRHKIGSEQGRLRIGRFLIQGLCDLYQGGYDPHFLTGLGSSLWVLGRYGSNQSLATQALIQYLDFYFSHRKS